jgi:archaemetzincin
VKVRLKRDPRVPEPLAQRLLADLPTPFAGGHVASLPVDTRTFFDRHRRQVDAAALLEALEPPPPGEVLLALTADDLFVSVMSYVFGLTELGARRGVLSLARLGEGAPLALETRTLVEAIHELGHGLGLVHCPVADCAMHRTLWPEQIDLKRAEYCPSCLETLLSSLAATS